MMTLLLSLTAAYLLGSVSPSYLFGRMLKGIDLRQHGSGNVGATNAFRVLGRGPGMITLFLDVGKGLLAVMGFPAFAAAFFSIPVDLLLYKILLGCAVIAGHNWSLFLKFKGGKGVATSCGVFLALSPKALLLSACVWLLVIVATRNVGLGSLSGALFLPMAIYFLGYPPGLVFFGVLMALSVFYTHRTNIREVFFEKKT